MVPLVICLYRKLFVLFYYFLVPLLFLETQLVGQLMLSVSVYLFAQEMFTYFRREW
jgi:hypothetical protein